MEMFHNMNQKKKRVLLLLIVLLVTLVGGGVILFFHSQQTESPSVVISGDFLPAEKDARKIKDADLKKLAQAKVDKSKFNMVIEPQATIDATTQEGELAIQNPQQNAYPVSVDLRDDTSGEVIYTTGAIQPGFEVKQVHLERGLTNGKHQMTALFNIYDPSTKERRGQVSAEIELTVH